MWVRKGRCCGAANLTLATASEPPQGKDFQRVEAAGFELFLPTHLGRLPDELHIEMRRFPRRVEAYWDGCIWVV